MAYYNTRRLVESIIPIYSLVSVIEHGVNATTEQAKKDRQETLNLLISGMSDLLPKALTQKEKDEIMRRVRYVSDKLIMPEFVEQGKLAAKLGLVTYYFLNNMTEQGAYTIVEGSNFDQALGIFLPAMVEWAEKDNFNKSSIKEAHRMLNYLQSHGYYKDIKWVLNSEGVFDAERYNLS